MAIYLQWNFCIDSWRYSKAIDLSYFVALYMMKFNQNEIGFISHSIKDAPDV